MKPVLAAMIFAVVLAISGIAAEQGSSVSKVDQKISVQANDVGLGYLLHLWDKATGMHSTVPAGIADRTMSVRFSGLGEDEAVRKLFEKQPYDYIFAPGKGITVTGLKQDAEVEAPPPMPAEEPAAAAPPVIQPPAFENPQPPVPAAGSQVREKPSAPPAPEYPPAILTPFGPAYAPSGNQPMTQLPPVLGAPPAPPFFGTPAPAMPPAGAANGPVINQLFGPLPVYQNATPPVPNASEQRP